MATDYVRPPAHQVRVTIVGPDSTVLASHVRDEDWWHYAQPAARDTMAAAELDEYILEAQPRPGSYTIVIRPVPAGEAWARASRKVRP